MPIVNKLKKKQKYSHNIEITKKKIQTINQLNQHPNIFFCNQVSYDFPQGSLTISVLPPMSMFFTLSKCQLLGKL